jgi:hypothetical protein
MNNNENPGYYRFVIGNSPLGAMEIICSDLGLFMVNYFTTNNPHPEIRLVNNHPILKETEFQILEYLTGNLKRFTIPIAVSHLGKQPLTQRWPPPRGTQEKPGQRGM